MKIFLQRMHLKNFSTYVTLITLWVAILCAVSVSNELAEGKQFIPNLFNHLTPPEIIKSNGYPEKTYDITTPDGYILQLYRIPHGKKKGEGDHFPILFIHGFADSSYSWIANGPNRSLAYLLADQGCDVWLMNERGNTYSRNHTNYTTNDREFWDFSFHEIGIYDLPTTIDFILNKTHHKQLLCISISAGNSIFYIMMSELPAYNDKIIAQISIAPYYRESHLLINSSTPYNSDFSAPFLDRSFLNELAFQIMSRVDLFSGYNLYDFLLYLAFNLPPDHINREIMQGVYDHFPAGTSVKASQHSLQLGSSLRHFDYGSKENLKQYGTTYPPMYNISNVRVPVRIYHAKHDSTALPKEVQLLHDKLPVKAGVKMVSDPGFSHLDFLYARNVNELVNNDILKFVDEIVKNSSNNTKIS